MSTANTIFGCLMGLYAFAGGWLIAFGTRDWRFRRRGVIAAAPSPTLRFCRDCRWAVAPPSGFFGATRDFTRARCMHPTSVLSEGNFLASGLYTPDNAQHCSVMRRHTASGSCGETGMHWELRDDRAPKLIGEL